MVTGSSPPAALLKMTAATAPRSAALLTLVEKAQAPRWISAIFPCRSVVWETGSVVQSVSVTMLPT